MKTDGLYYTDFVPFPGEWRERAACRDKDTAIFFSPGGKGRYSSKPDPRLAQAKEICRGCCVRDECLSYGLKYYMVGIWGGLTDQERKAYRRAMRVA